MAGGFSLTQYTRPVGLPSGSLPSSGKGLKPGFGMGGPGLKRSQRLFGRLAKKKRKRPMASGTY